MRFKELGLGIVCALALAISPATALAQTSMGGVTGTVTDTTGAVVPGATVTLANEATGIQSTRVTDESGYFVFVNLRPGTYTLTVELSGFSTARVAPFVVGVNETVGRNVTLEVGEVTEVVQVTARSELLQVATAELGNVVEEKVIRELPIQGRNFTQLLLLSPGVNPVSTAQGSKDSLGFGTEGNSGLPNSEIANASVQGQQNRSKIYYMDGIVNTSMRAGTYVALPDLDSLQEFKVQSHSDKAEFGGVTGGVINMTTKSGTNEFGGSAFGFFRNENFVARDPFRDVDLANDVPLDVPEFRQSQFGASFHGPLIRDKTFFFASYDAWRYRDFLDIRMTVPAAGELNGDFSQSFHGRTIYNPFTTRIENGQEVRDPFPGNVIPPELIDPGMQAFFQAYLPRPTINQSVPNNFQQRRERTSDSNSFQIRLDHYFSDRDNVFIRYTQRNIDNFVPEGDRSFEEPGSKNYNFGGGWFHSFSPNLILELRGGWTNQVTEDAPTQHELGVAPQQGLGLPNLDQYFGYIATDESPWSWNDLGVRGARPRENPNWNIAADLTWLKGKHNFKIGFQMLEISRLQENQFGQLRFSTNQTANPLSTGNSGDSLASALLGLPDRIQAFVPEFGSIDFKTATISGYIQDQWAIKPDLTLTYGIRYDYITKATGRGLQSGPDMDTGEWLVALPALPGVCNPDGSTPPPCLPSPLEEIPFNELIRATGEEFSILQPIADNIGPRVGLAWQINPRTVLRTGYSLMWDSMVSRSQYGQHQFESWGWPQFSGIDTGALNQISDGADLTNYADGDLGFGLPAPQPWNAGGWFNDPDRKNAYSHQWHAEVQREVTRDLMVAVGYVGSHNGRMEYAGYAAAPPVPAIAPDGRRLTSAERDQLRPQPHLGQGNFRYAQSIGDANYNALQVKVQRRFANGLASVLSYTLSRTTDTSSGWFAAESGIGGRNSDVQNYHDMDDARGTSSYDIPHILTWGGIWELPLSGAVLGGWQFNWNVIARSGQPFHVTAPGDPANIGVGGERQRADLVGDPELPNPDENMWFNTAAFAVPVNDFGNSERNLLRAPGYWNVDFGLQKNIALGTDRTLQLRIDLFNAFNHINLGDPETRMARGTFGTIDDMRRFPRQLEIGARIIF